jgi:hypothetical protein
MIAYEGWCRGSAEAAVAGALCIEPGAADGIGHANCSKAQCAHCRRPHKWPTNSNRAAIAEH